MKIIEIIETRFEDELVRADVKEHDVTFRELFEMWRYHLFCGVLSQYPTSLDVGEDCRSVYISQDTSEGDRECIEKGYRKTQTFAFDRSNPKRYGKFWRRALVLLDIHDRLIH
ncbi:hypothetical protein AB9X29_003750 [Vibrio vulnificus]